MFVYMVLSGIPYEGEDVLGIFSDYAKAQECETKYDTGEIGYTKIIKVEVDKNYDDVFGGIGEEV